MFRKTTVVLLAAALPCLTIGCGNKDSSPADSAAKAPATAQSDAAGGSESQNESKDPGFTQKVEATPEKLDLVALFPQWNDAIKLTGDAQAGREYYQSHTINNDLTCASCHSFLESDTMEVDGDKLVRAGFPIYAAVHRTNVKNSGTNLAAAGGNLCTLHFMGSEEPSMNAQELANLDAFLKTGGGAKHAVATNVDYVERDYPSLEKLDTGDAGRGASLVVSHCSSCHGVAEASAKTVETGYDFQKGDYGADDLGELAARIRNKGGKHNDVMPGFSNLRMTDARLLDILAWMTTK